MNNQPDELLAARSWRRFFNREAETFGASVQTSHYYDEKSFYAMRRALLQWLGDVENKTILDAGCGVGAVCESLVAHNTVYGVDFSDRSIAFAAQRGLHGVCADLAALPFEENSFDMTLCIGVLQHFHDCIDIVRALHRVTKPGGVLLVLTLNSQSLQRRLLAALGQPAPCDRMYAMHELTALYGELGMTNIDFLNFYHPFEWVTRRRRPAPFQKYLSTTFGIRGRKQRSAR